MHGNACRAAIEAGYSPKTAEQAGPQLAKSKNVAAELKLRRQAGKSTAAAAAPADLSPLDFLLTTMRDESLDIVVRVRAAQIAAPFVHPRRAPAGKKEAADEAAKAPSRFKPTNAPPRFTLHTLPARPKDGPT